VFFFFFFFMEEVFYKNLEIFLISLFVLENEFNSCTNGTNFTLRITFNCAL